MAFGRRWTPSRAQKRAFAQTMDEVAEYCRNNHISASTSMDSFYFEINGQGYRVSNHSVESSPYHSAGERKRFSTRYIHASKTRLIEIHKALLAGKTLNGRGEEVRC